MSFTSLAQVIPGGNKALDDVLKSEKIQQAASTLGINLQDPLQLTQLLEKVKDKVESMTGRVLPKDDSKMLANPYLNPFRRNAIQTYQQISMMG